MFVIKKVVTSFQTNQCFIRIILDKDYLKLLHTFTTFTQKQ